MDRLYFRILGTISAWGGHYVETVRHNVCCNRKTHAQGRAIMRMFQTAIWVATLFAMASFSTTTYAKEKYRFQYAAKFVCGFDPSGAILRVIPGQWATSVLIHNPQHKKVKIRKKVALTFPPAAQAPGRVSEFIHDELGPDQALQVDCEEIGGHPENARQAEATPSEFFPPDDTGAGGLGLFTGGFPPYIQGYVIIESTYSVDVTAIITAGAASRTDDDPDDAVVDPTAGPVAAMDVQQIRERKLRKPRKRDRDDDDDDGDDDDD